MNSMQKIFFPGNMRQACEAWYGVILSDTATDCTASVLVVQTDKVNPGAMGTSLWNTGEGLNNVLNRILSTDLVGVRTEFVRFVSALDVGGSLHAMEFPICLDIDDFIAKGNRYDVMQAPAQDWLGTLKNLAGLGNKQFSFWSGDVVGGCARFYTNFDDGKAIDSQVVRKWMRDLSCPF